MMRLPAATKLATLEWIPKARHPGLARLGLATLGDLLRHFPKRHEDRRKFDRFPCEASEVSICVFGGVKKTKYQRFGARRIFEIVVAEENENALSTPLTCRWFNMPWIAKMITGGDRIVLYGKPRLRGQTVVMEHPDFEIIEEEGEASLHFDRITPVHPAGDGIPARVLRELIHRALAVSEMPEFLWPELRTLNGEVWKAVHFPESMAEFERARETLVREEFFALQIVLLAKHQSIQTNGGVSRRSQGSLWKAVKESLSFDLTAAQIRVIDEVCRDIASPKRMNRLLQGDVGSGKTLVALAAMLQVVEAGWQAVLMAPTQILAEQHFLTFRRLLEPLSIPVWLHTSATRSGVAETARPGIGIGTHALLYENVAIERLGLVVIDEQHKFGVLQRSRLIARGDAPDVLVMTATPIPRTMTQTLYGDLDVSTLDEKPPGRGSLVTVVRDDSRLPDITAFLQKNLAQAQQAYIVYPLVEDSEKVELKSAKVAYEKWKSILAPSTVGLIHGRLSSLEKEEIMRGFRAGDFSVLVATTVIEVGVDVPQATMMLIENADRFGLSQLHQLRGRIGRGSTKSYCVLLHSGAKAEALERLAILEKTLDGFAIAEADLEMRGPGDILGIAQSGLPPLRLGDLLRDRELMTECRNAAGALLASDPMLARPEHRLIHEHVQQNLAQVVGLDG